MANENHKNDQINVGEAYCKIRDAFDSALDALNRLGLGVHHAKSDDPAAADLGKAINNLRWGLALLGQYCQLNQSTCFVLPSLSKALSEYCAKAEVAAALDPHGNLIPSAFLNVALANALDGGLSVFAALERYQELARPANKAGESHEIPAPGVRGVSPRGGR